MDANENKPDRKTRILFYLFLAIVLLFLTIWFGLRLLGII